MTTYELAPYEEKMMEALAKKYDISIDAAIYMCLQNEYCKHFGWESNRKLMHEWVIECKKRKGLK